MKDSLNLFYRNELEIGKEFCSHFFPARLTSDKYGQHKGIKERKLFVIGLGSGILLEAVDAQILSH